MIGGMVDRFKSAYVDDVKKDVGNAIDIVVHRIEFGSPILLDESEDLTVSPAIALSLKQERIRRRRLLLGLKWEPWQGPDAASPRTQKVVKIRK